MPSLAQKRAALDATLRQHPPSEIDPHSTVYGVLLSDEIAFYADHHGLITPFDRANLKPAAYELTIGDEYFLSGEFLTLDTTDDKKNKVIIRPFEVAVLKTTEVLCLPRYLIARWNIRVRHAYSGLLWVGGPQVDPGYAGHLFCPIYNLSDKPVTLRAGDPIAVIDFVKTTPYDKDTKSPDLVSYPFPPKKLILEDYGIDELRSALFTKVGAKITEFEQEINSLGVRFNFFTQISFAIFALVITVVSITSRVSADSLSLLTSISGSLTLAISVAAILIVIFSSVSRRMDRLMYEQVGRLMGSRAQEARRFLQRAWLLGISTSIIIAVVAGIWLYHIVDPIFRDVRQGQVLTKSDLDGLTNSTSTEFRELATRVHQLEEEIQTMKSDVNPSGR